ncbi:MAG TPA: class I SAM-dependent methyltransferase [Chryseosolibacter sp.]
MALPFDHIASPYNSMHSRSAIGQLQRKKVWGYVETIIPELKGFEMLELNQGTGEDANLFSEHGFNLIATDIGAEMMKITERRSGQFSLQHTISSHYIDLETFNETLFGKKFDLVFSNFGGINAINPESLKKLLAKLPSILKPGGRFIGVVMPKFCAWETVFFLLRFQVKKAFRRLTSKEVLGNLQGGETRTWFYSPRQITNWSKEKFRLVRCSPVGVTLPPVYLERFFKLRKKWLLNLNDLEKKFGQSSLFSGMSDNFIVDLQLK